MAFEPEEFLGKINEFLPFCPNLFPLNLAGCPFYSRLVFFHHSSVTLEVIIEFLEFLFPGHIRDLAGKFGSYLFRSIDVRYGLVKTVSVLVEDEIFLVAPYFQNIIEKILKTFNDSQPPLNGNEIPVIESGEDDHKGQAGDKNGNNPSPDGAQHLFLSLSLLLAGVILAEGMERNKLGGPRPGRS
jgi:hypothetical protein